MTGKRAEEIACLRIARGREGEVPVFVDFDVPYRPGASVLDGLIWIREEQDPSLAIRYSCINANVCKECTMQVDGQVTYACVARLKPGVTTLEPLPSKRLIRDLVTDTVPPKERL